MDEIVGSCIACGQQRKFVVWHESKASGICAPCYNKASATDGGYVVRHQKRGDVFKNRVYRNWSDAKAALDGMVWHSRDGFAIQPAIFVAAALPERQEGP